MINPHAVNITDETDIHTVVLVKVRFKQKRWTQKWDSVEVPLGI